ncbi:MAG: ThuA domain-containing protein [Fimbriimonas sp.]
MPTSPVLLVGGCPHPFHHIEPTIQHFQSVTDALGLELEVHGIFHPDDGDAEGNYSAISAEKLAQHKAVILFTTGEGHGEDVAALLEFVRNGGAIIGIHCASDSFTSNAEWVRAIGGKFRTHPAPLDIEVEFVDGDHEITKGVEPFTIHDELYLFADYDPANVHLLAQTNSYTPEGEEPAPIPVAWTRSEGAGKIFYISLGHFPAAMAHPQWQTLVQRGLRWALA